MDLVAAAKARRFARIPDLLKAGADPNQRNRKGETALHWAVVHGEQTAVEALLNAGASPSPKTTSKWAMGNGAAGETPLHFASAYGRLEIMTALIKAGADVSAGNSLGVRPIVAAIHSPDPESLRLLVAAGADPNDESAGYRPLDIAAGHAGPETVSALLELGARPQGRSGDEYPPLRRAIACGKLDNAELLRQAGAVWEQH